MSKKDTKRRPLSAVVEASDRSAYVSSSKVGPYPSASFWRKLILASPNTNTSPSSLSQVRP